MTTETKAGTTLEILAPYLPYGIEVETGCGPSRILSIDFGATCQLDTCTVEDYENGEINGHNYYAFAHVLPRLRPFSALTERLSDGAIPAVEVAKLLTGGEDGEYSYKVSKSEYGGGFTVEADIDGELVYVLDLRPDWSWFISDLLAEANHEEIKVAQPATIIDYLRRNHFAVGLDPSQFIAK